MSKLVGWLTRPFRTLQWRFSLSYMLVTVLSVLAVPTLYFAASYLFAIRSPDLPRLMADGLEGEAPLALPYLVQQPVDRTGLRTWLVDFNSNGRVQGTGSFADLWMSGPPYGTSQMALVDTTGHVLVSTSPAAFPEGGLAASRLTAAGRQVLRVALAGDKRPDDLATPEANGRSLIAVPITIPGRTVGALVLDMDVGATQAGFLPRAAQGLIGFVLIISVVAGLVGLVFGFVVSRGMARRLRTISQAADAWSQGNFSAAAHDPSGDELGRLTRDLNGMAEQIQSLLQDRQQLAIVEERNRLARDLHDSVKQQVFATAMQVAAARALVQRDPSAAEARLAEVERLVGEAQRELTALIGELRPAALADKGLAQALREYCAEWSGRVGIAADVRVRSEQPAPLEVEQALFRVAQEALSNVARHSDATRVEVELAWEPEALQLSITDNGRGMDAAAADGQGVGLHSMQERVEALRGSLAIRAAPGGSGTSIQVWVPLAQSTSLAHRGSASGSGAAVPDDGNV
jgi:NarL family two-component system sensor histidine kinase LiaS